MQVTDTGIIKKVTINSFKKAQHHDDFAAPGELVFDAVQEEIEYITPKIKELMATALLLPHGVPLEVEVGSGRNWLQAH